MHHSVLKCSNIKEYQHVLHGDALQLFEASIPLMEKPGRWFLLAKCVKNTCGRVTF